MRVIFQNKLNKRLIIDFGYTTPLFSCVYFISCVTEYLENNEIIFAKWHFGLFKHYKFWFKK